MFNIKLADNKILIVGSTYDSGVHTGFTAAVIDEGEYFKTPISNILTREQIKAVEAVLASTIKSLVE